MQETNFQQLCYSEERLWVNPTSLELWNSLNYTAAHEGNFIQKGKKFVDIKRKKSILTRKAFRDIIFIISLSFIVLQIFLRHEKIIGNIFTTAQYEN